METNNSGEAEAILAVIDAETRAFWAKDFATLSRCWLQEDFVRRAGWWEAGGITWRKGWQTIGERMKRQMDNSPQASTVAQTLRRENIFVRVLGDMAWVTFDQIAENGADPDMDMPGLSHEMRIMEKQDGNWKIACHTYLLEGSTNEA